MFKILLISLILLSSCQTLPINTPEQLEQAIYSHTTYADQFLNCRERAQIATRWLTENGYTYQTCGEMISMTLRQIYIKWFKDNQTGTILRYPNQEGSELWCTGQMS